MEGKRKITAHFDGDVATRIQCGEVDILKNAKTLSIELYVLLLKIFDQATSSGDTNITMPYQECTTILGSDFSLQELCFSLDTLFNLHLYWELPHRGFFSNSIFLHIEASQETVTFVFDDLWCDYLKGVDIDCLIKRKLSKIK